MRGKQLTLSTMLGGVYGLVWPSLWVAFLAFSPHVSWFIDLGLRAGPLDMAHHTIVLLFSVVLAIPIAFALIKLNSSSIALGTAVATIGWAATSLAQMTPSVAIDLISSATVVMHAAAIPLAVLLVRQLQRRKPNNSFNPMPLRGTG